MSNSPSGCGFSGVRFCIARPGLRNLSGQPQLDRAGHHVQIDGKGQFTKIMEWNSRDLSDAFSKALVALVREQYPDALTDQEEAEAPVS
jgi:hypothetical protein